MVLIMKNRQMAGIAVMAVLLMVGVSCAMNTAGDGTPGAMDEERLVDGESDNPSITVTNQDVIVDPPVGFVFIARVASDGPGWIVIQNDLYGRPGGIVGYAHVDAGVSRNVRVPIDLGIATDHLIAELHQDRGRIGVFEYPPPIDGKARTGGREITQPFAITANGTPLLNITALSRIEPE